MGHIKTIVLSAKWKTRKIYIATVAVILVFISSWFYGVDIPSGLRSYSLRPPSPVPRDFAANSTLGFEKILVLSPQASWRTRGLVAAADHTGLDIIIPTQPYIHDDVLAAFQHIGDTDTHTTLPSRGSARAWLAHLDMLKFVVASGFSTALIIEDDVDWDVAIRDQMKLVSDTVRNFTRASDLDSTPFGNTWDILWLGHCGEVTKPEAIRLEYFDPTVISRELYAGWTKEWLYNVAEKHRVVQRTHHTVCTFGYAVTRTGAQNVLRVLGGGRDEAFDIAMMTECRSQKLQCLTVNPELMHHYNPKDGMGYVSPSGEANGKGHSSNEELFEHLMGTTANMEHSARCEVLFNDVCLQPPS